MPICEISSKSIREINGPLELFVLQSWMCVGVETYFQSFVPMSSWDKNNVQLSVLCMVYLHLLNFEYFALFDESQLNKMAFFFKKSTFYASLNQLRIIYTDTHW